MTTDTKGAAQIVRRTYVLQPKSLERSPRKPPIISSTALDAEITYYDILFTVEQYFKGLSLGKNTNRQFRQRFGSVLDSGGSLPHKC